MQYTLATPTTVGDLQHQTVIDKLEIASISMNFEPLYSDNGTAILSVMLVHRESGYKMNVVYSDASALAFWQAHQGTLGPDAFAKLIADSKLPAGTLSTNTDAGSETSTTATTSTVSTSTATQPAA